MLNLAMIKEMRPDATVRYPFSPIMLATTHTRLARLQGNWCSHLLIMRMQKGMSSTERNLKKT